MPRRRSELLVALSALTLLAGCGGNEEATAQVPATFFGVAPHDPPNRADFARMGHGKVGSYRLLVNWQRVETHEGRYNWRFYDQLVSELARNGIQPIPYVFGTPPRFGARTSAPPTRSERSLGAWTDFLRATAARYGPNGSFWSLFPLLNPGKQPRPFRVWEIWNEQNAPAFWAGRPDPGAYATLLTRSAAAIRSVDRDAEIMVGGMFATPSAGRAINAFRFLRQLFRVPGVDRAVDIVGSHPYGPNMRSVRSQLQRTRREMRRAGLGDRDLWVTEIGWGSRRGGHAQLGKSRGRQAALLRRTFGMLIRNRDRWNVRGGIWYTWRDPDRRVGECDWCTSAGLLERDRTPKPAWNALTRLTGGG